MSDSEKLTKNNVRPFPAKPTPAQVQEAQHQAAQVGALAEGAQEMLDHAQSMMRQLEDILAANESIRKSLLELAGEKDKTDKEK